MEDPVGKPLDFQKFLAVSESAVLVAVSDEAFRHCLVEAGDVR